MSVKKLHKPLGIQHTISINKRLNLKDLSDICKSKNQIKNYVY